MPAEKKDSSPPRVCFMKHPPLLLQAPGRYGGRQNQPTENSIALSTPQRRPVSCTLPSFFRRHSSKITTAASLSLSPQENTTAGKKTQEEKCYKRGTSLNQRSRRVRQSGLFFLRVNCVENFPGPALELADGRRL